MNKNKIKEYYSCLNWDELRKEYLFISFSNLPENEKSVKQTIIEKEIKERVHKLTA